jgi:hypothetical protein
MFHMNMRAFSEDAFRCSAVFKWHKRFAQGRGSLEDDEHTGRPRAVRTELKIKEFAMLVCANLSQMADEIAAAPAGISHGICHRSV